MIDPAIIIYTKMVDRKLAVLVFHVQELSIAKEQGNRAVEGRAYAKLGDAYFHLDNFKQAIECYTKSLSIFQEVGCREGEGIICGGLGEAYYFLGDFLKQKSIICNPRVFAKRRGTETCKQ